uniref:chemotaxis protein CheW n=1 Tax=Candidatus Electrothrix sp. TaxID=2170559 RepID=UPI0040572D20
MRELLLLDLAEFRCGVWKEDILSHDEQNIHWLTSKDGAVTAIAMMGAHPVSLADLSYCLGLTPARRARRCPVLVPAGHDLSVSFVVEQEVGEVEVHSSEILPLPAYLQTPFISSCVELEGKLLPLINILTVQHQVAAADYSPPVPPLHHSFQQDVLQEKNQEKKAPSLDTLRVFTCKRKSFLASAEYFSPDKASSPGPLTTLPLVPDFVQGVSLYRHQVLIILDLRRYLQLPPEQGDEEGKWLIGTVEGQGFAFVVDDDQGGVSADAGSFALLPVLIRSAWRQHAFLYERKIISVLDFRELLAFSPDEIYSQTASPHVLRVDTDKGLEAAFRKQQFEILEFSLCNMTHALPDAEVRDTLPFTHCQRLAGTRGLVLGMTLYKDELLPVLDPARCFGRDSQPTSGWQLLLVCNGVLRALVLVEKILGTRMLSVGEQRMLPFAVPQSSVYGCYPVDGQVGLILNMLALTVYFNFNDEQAKIGRA